MSSGPLLVLWLVSVALSAALRSRVFATFLGILTGVCTLLWIALAPLLETDALRFAFAALQVTVFVHFVSLVRPRLRPWPWRFAVSIPALWFAAGTLLALPWGLAAAMGLPTPGWWIPYLIAAFGTVQSLRGRLSRFDLVLDGAPTAALQRYPLGKTAGRNEPALRIVHLADPHLGPFMSPRRLRRLCEGIAAEDPDLVLLTGDLLTMESQQEVEELSEALSPLAKLDGRVFACLGNHDLEAMDTVEESYARNGIRLLVDEGASVETRAGVVQVVGVDFVWRRRREHLNGVLRRVARPGDARLRILLLHDPWAFADVPEGEGDLVLAGHTHGGQLGLLSLGVDWTVLRLFAPGRPDHGFWARGRDRLYVSRGAGHYGFPLRLGVPAEIALVQLHLP